MKGDTTPSVNLYQVTILDHEVLAAARFCAAAGAEDILDVLGIRTRAVELAAPYVGSRGWLGPLIARLKPVGYLELRKQKKAS